jgi:hypothetical protein
MILGGDLKFFTCNDIAAALDIPGRKARAAINYGLYTEAIRPGRTFRSENGKAVTYELARWYKEWITKPWK